MRKLGVLLLMVFAGVPSLAQDNLRMFLVSGVEDSHRFANEYLRPGTEAAMYNLSNGWYQSAEVKRLLGFEFSIIGNASINLDNHHSFILNTEEYQNLEFTDGAIEREVGTVFGENDPELEVLSYYDFAGEERTLRFDLPQGLGSTGLNFFPLAFLQARLGLFKGTEVKVRYFPKINYNEVQAGLYGGALQHEFTSWLPASDLFPVAVSGLVGYTRIEGSYDFSERQAMEGSDQKLTAEMDTWTFAAIVSTKIPVVNFYGGIGYATGTAETRMLGEYIIVDEVSGESILTVENPVEVIHEIEGMFANLGVSIKLGIMKLTVDYNFQKYNTVSVGAHVGL